MEIERRALREQQLKQAYLDAAQDPAFLEEMEEIDRAFDVTVGDGLEPEDHQTK